MAQNNTVCETPPCQDAYTHQIWNSYLKEYKRYAWNTKILTTRSEVKITVTLNGMYDTPPSQDAFRHQIWNSYLKEYRRYAPDTKRDGRTNGRTDRQCDYYMPPKVPLGA